jgi:hypothetical protein
MDLLPTIVKPHPQTIEAMCLNAVSPKIVVWPQTIEEHVI